MRIAHFAPFGPHRCGLYETTRDMIRAERLAGCTSELVDIGIEGVRAVGGKDDRPGLSLIARDYPEVADFDLFVSNSSILDSFVAKTSAPIVQIVHGRPESSFRLSQKDPKNHPVYPLYYQRARRERWRKFVSLWPEHEPYLKVLIPSEKLVSIEAPCDLDLHNPEGVRHRFDPLGEINLLVADIWREDVDPYHIAHAIITAAEEVPGLKAHFYACRTPLGPWDFILRRLKEMGALGETKGHMRGLGPVLRAADLVVTPHTIATRIIRESLASGTPVVAPYGCRFASWNGPLSDPKRMGWTIVRACRDMKENPALHRTMARNSAMAFGLHKFGQEITRIYREVLNGAA